MQGFNMGRYVPPEHEGTLSFNQVSKKNTVSPTVRFEMPFPIWCTTCSKPTIIGQGVRFNAIKKKIGNYYSTSIFSFRMKHVVCGGWIEIRTDPKNTAYVVAEGARKRDLGEDKVEEGDIKIMSTEEREALRANAFANLEVKIEDRVRLEEAKVRIEELQEVQDTFWADPAERNKQLRKTFRVGRKARESEVGRVTKLQDKMSLGLEILPENEDDVRRAAYVDFGVGHQELSNTKVLSRPLFNAVKPKDKIKSVKERTKKQRAGDHAEKRRQELAMEIRSNTRAKTDPFLIDTPATKSSIQASLGIKRKRVGEGVETQQTVAKVLVDYDSE